MRKGELAKELPEHGTLPRYKSRIDPCRCDSCRGAYNEYMRIYRQSDTWKMKYRSPEQRELTRRYNAAWKAKRKAAAS